MLKRAIGSVRTLAALVLFISCLSGCERTAPPPRSQAAPAPVPAPAPGASRRSPRAPRTPAAPVLRAPHGHSEVEAFAERCRGRGAQRRFKGEVSYYSDALAGRATASGEPYRPELPTAAHRSLPFGSVLRVAREGSHEVVCVRVNDRGPFVRGRILDVSRAVAEELGIVRLGVAPVRVEVVELGAARAPAKRRAPPRKKKRKRR